MRAPHTNDTHGAGPAPKDYPEATQRNCPALYRAHRVAGLRLAWRRHGAQLLHESQHVSLSPLLGYLAACEPQDADAGQRYFLACGWDAHEFTLVCAAERPMPRHLVPFRDQIVGGASSIGERCEHGRVKLPMPLAVEGRAARHVEGIVRSEQLVHDRRVMPVPYLFIEPQDDGLVL